MRPSEFARSMEKLNRERSESNRAELSDAIERSVSKDSDYYQSRSHDEAYYAGQEQAYRAMAIHLEGLGL